MEKSMGEDSIIILMEITMMVNGILIKKKVFKMIIIKACIILVFYKLFS